MVALVITSRGASGVLTPCKGFNLHNKVCHDLFLCDGSRVGLTGGSAAKGGREGWRQLSGVFLPFSDVLAPEIRCVVQQCFSYGLYLLLFFILLQNKELVGFWV